MKEPEEGLAHGSYADIIHRKSLAIPIARAAHLLQLVGNYRFVFILERLNLGNKLIAAEVGPPLLFVFHHPLFNHRLCGNPGVIRPGHPQGFKPPHSVGAHQNILKGVVQRVAEV